LLHYYALVNSSELGALSTALPQSTVHSSNAHLEPGELHT